MSVEAAALDSNLPALWSLSQHKIALTNVENALIDGIGATTGGGA